MFCFRYRKLLMPYSEGALAPAAAARLRRHVASCARCGEELSAITAMARTLRQAEIPAMEPSADLWARVRSEIEARPEPRAIWRVRSFQAASAGAVAAVLLLFVLIRLPNAPVQRKESTRSAKSEVSALGKSLQVPLPAGERVTTARPRGKGSLYVPVPKELRFEPRADRAVSPFYYSTPAMPSAPIYREVEPKAFDRVFPLPPPPAPSGPTAAGRDQSTTTFHYNPGYASGSAGPKVGYAAPSAPGQVSASKEGLKAADSDSFARAASPPPAADAAAVPAKPAASASAGVSPKAEVSGRIADDKGQRELGQLRDRYNEELAKKPDDAQTLSKLAELDEKRADKAAVVKWRKRLTEVCPKDPARWAELGRAYESNSQTAEAVAAYKQAISLGLTGSSEADVKERIRKLSEAPKAPASSGR
ncbi:MAG: zf-HC2 domain-containing protein [Armatimonadota bacterium]|nr:zf-HC2 domain-containing protein [Armatimonadota bacterium]